VGFGGDGSGLFKIAHYLVCRIALRQRRKHSQFLHHAEYFAIWSQLLSPQDSGERMVPSRRVPLTEEASMVSVPKVVGVMLYGCVLGLGLYLNGSHTIKGEVVRVEPNSYFVQQYDGDQVSVYADDTTQVTGNIHIGNHIEAKVNAQSHALSIHQAQ
jgi:hypothetical protein